MFSNIQSKLELEPANIRLNLTAEETAEKMLALKESAQNVKQALNTDLELSSDFRRMKRL